MEAPFETAKHWDGNGMTRKEQALDMARSAIDEILSRCDTPADAARAPTSGSDDVAVIKRVQESSPTGTVADGDFYREQRYLIQIVDEVIGAVEDVIASLLAKNTLSLFDLPPGAQKFVRRDKLPGDSLGVLMVDEGDVRLP